MISLRSTVLAGSVVLAAIVSTGLVAQPKAKPTLDYDFYKARVEPIFLKKKAGHTRCVVCHSESNNFLRFEPLEGGAKAWSEEQSRKNFEMAAKLVNPGDPNASPLLMQPLAPEGGGNVFHLVDQRISAAQMPRELKQLRQMTKHKVHRPIGFRSTRGRA